MGAGIAGGLPPWPGRLGPFARSSAGASWGLGAWPPQVLCCIVGVEEGFLRTLQGLSLCAPKWLIIMCRSPHRPLTAQRLAPPPAVLAYFIAAISPVMDVANAILPTCELLACESKLNKDTDGPAAAPRAARCACPACRHTCALPCPTPSPHRRHHAALLHGAAAAVGGHPLLLALVRCFLESFVACPQAMMPHQPAANHSLCMQSLLLSFPVGFELSTLTERCNCCAARAGSLTSTSCATAGVR